MKRTILIGSLYACTATTIIGSSIAVSSLLTHYPALGSQAIRYALGAGGLAIIVKLRGLPLPQLSLKEILLLLVLALTGLVGFNLCLVAAVSYNDPASVGALIGSVPIVLAVLGPISQRRFPTFFVVIGALVVSIGACIVEGASATTPIGILLAFGALIGEASFTLLAVPLLPRLGPMILSLYVSIVASIMLAILSVIIDGTHTLLVPTFPELFAIGYLALVVTVGAFLAWYSGLARLGTERAGLFSGLIPVSSLVFGVCIGTDTITFWRLFGACLVGSGVTVGLAFRSKEAHSGSNLEGQIR